MLTVLSDGENESAFDKSKSADIGRRITSRDCCLILRQILGLLMVAPAVLLLAASAALAQGTPNAAPTHGEPTKVKVGQIGAVSDAGIFIAQEKGFFQKMASTPPWCLSATRL